MALSTDHWSVNYEGGKIVDHALDSPLCDGYSNVQIAMDAPFLGKPAEESFRRSAVGMRTETSFTDFDEQRLVKDLTQAIRLISKSTKGKLLVVQIARGSSAENMENDIVRPALLASSIERFKVTWGYRTTTYFSYPNERFILLNIGMLASLTYILRAGEICIPLHTYDVTKTPSGLKLGRHRSHDDDLLASSNFTKTNLFGIDDDMSFVTPSNYPDGARQFNELIKVANAKYSR